MSEQGAERAVITITGIDFKPSFVGSSLVGKTKVGKEMRFFFRPDTDIRKIGSEEITKQLGEFLGEKAALPFRVGEEVQVLWKIDPATSQRTAVRITVIE